MGRGCTCIAKAGQLQNQSESVVQYERNQDAISRYQFSVLSSATAKSSNVSGQVPRTVLRIQRVLKLFFPIFSRVLTGVFQLIALQ